MMLSSYWESKSDGYELVDGSAHSSASSRSSSPNLDSYTHHRCDTHTPYQRSKSSSSNSVISQSLCLLRRNRRRITLIFVGIVVFSTLESILGIILSPPAYVVLPPDQYLQTLEAAVRDRMPLQSIDVRDKILSNLKELKVPFNPIDHHRLSSAPTISTVPNKLFSSDQHEPSSDWAPMWKEKGFEAHFYNDSEANAWVEREWRGTDIIEAWRKMPRSIL